jgi:hypothetical protein
MGLGTVAAAFSVWTFGADRTIYRREFRSGINSLCYFLAANLIDALKCALFALFFVSAYFLVAAPYGSFLEYFLLCYCFILVNFGMGYVVSTLFQPANAAIIATLTATVAGVFSGFVFQFIPVWPWYFGEGLFRSEANYIVEHATSNETDWVGLYANLQYGYRVNDTTLQNDNMWMLIYAAGFRVLAYVSLRFFNRG